MAKVLGELVGFGVTEVRAGKGYKNGPEPKAMERARGN